MANPRAFISFDFDHDSDQKLLFAGQIKNSRTPFNVEDWSSKESLPQKEWEKLIEEKMSKTNMIIILVGRYMASAIGVRKEIKMASKNNVPIFGVYVDGASSQSNLPAGLFRSRTVKWDWSKIADKIDQCMKEGKNA